jgi:hypothetical protein
MIQNVNYTMKVDGNNYTLDVDQHEYKVTLSRTGGQGSRGHSVTNASVESGNLILEISDSAGNVVENLNAGSFVDLVDMGTIAQIADLQDGDIIAYNEEESRWGNHKLRTSSISDIDNTNKSDGALLVYNSSSEKYTATTTIENQNTTISGGTF